MRAVYLEQVGRPVEVREVPDPRLRPSGVVVDVLAVRIPSYTRDVFSGALAYDLPGPLVPGPTCVGVVDQVAEDVFHLNRGDVVLCNSFFSSGDADSPDEILIGWTGSGTERSGRMQRIWRDGSFAEKALYPASSLTVLPGAENWERPELLAYLASLAIADGGLRRGELRGGQSVIVNGATGNLGGAAVLAALARGAARVVATGRRANALESLAALDPRVATVRLSGDRGRDSAALRQAAGAGVDLVLDVIAHTPTPDPTLACIDALAPRGTAVLVGGPRHDLPLSYPRIQRQQLTIHGSFMFDSDTVLEIWQLVRSGALNVSAVTAHRFDLDSFAQGIDKAAELTGLDYAVLMPAPS